jgi:hypothetical protein
MRSSIDLGFCLLLFAVACVPSAFGDSLTLVTGRTLTGTLARTNGDDVLLVMDYAAFNFSRNSIKEIVVDQTENTELRDTNRIPAFRLIVSLLARQGWVSDIRPIPATVIDKGILRNVPYQSFRCGDDSEVNVYGDPERPAGVEVGLYRRLLCDDPAKTNCVNFIAALMGEAADAETVRALMMEKDLKRRKGLTFEITPPSAEDAYMGWWISVYADGALDLARASEEEMKRISLPKTEAEKVATTEDPTSWSAQDLRLSRDALPATITVTTKSGLVLSNAQVVRVNDGVDLLWRDGVSGGVLKLADLPDSLRYKFGYDPDKTALAEEIEKARKQREGQQAQAFAAQAVPQLTPQPVVYSDYSLPYSRSYGSRSISTGGSVYVHGYTRSDGTYVNSHTRSAPGSHGGGRR